MATAADPDVDHGGEAPCLAHKVDPDEGATTSRPTSTGADLLIRDVRLDASGARRNVAIRNGRIESIDDPRAEWKGPIVDGGGHFAMSGLVDGHTHVDKTMWGLPWRTHTADPERGLAGLIDNERTGRCETARLLNISTRSSVWLSVTGAASFALCDGDPSIPALVERLDGQQISLTTVAPGNVEPLPLDLLDEYDVAVCLDQDGIRDLWSPWGDADMLRPKPLSQLLPVRSW